MTGVLGVPANLARRLRAARVTAGVLTLCAGGALLSACSNAGVSLAQAACVHVYDSIHLYTKAEHATSIGTVRTDVDKAMGELEQALPLAARATSANPGYNPLMTTLQEIGRTSEANLIPALRAQCVAAQHPTSQSPVPAGPTSGTAPGGSGGGAGAGAGTSG